MRYASEIQGVAGRLVEQERVELATFFGTKGKDVYYGTQWPDKIYGNDGNDRLYGNGGDDWFDGGANEDMVDGGAGRDILHGGSGRDALYGGTGDDYANGGAGDDYLWDLSGKNILIGGDGNDRLVTNQFSSESGGTGNDTLVLKVEGAPKTGSAAFDGGTGYDTLQINNDGGAVDYAFIDLTGVGSGKMGLQSDIVNSDYWERTGEGTFSNVEAIEVTPGSKLYYEGRYGEGQAASENLTVKGGTGHDFFELGQDNETVHLGGGADLVYASGFNPQSLGVDHIVGFGDDDLLLLGWGSNGSSVDIQETGGNTVVTAFLDNVLVDTITVDAVGIQDSIWLGWTPV